MQLNVLTRMWPDDQQLLNMPSLVVDTLTISDDSHIKHSPREMMDNSEAQAVIGLVWNDHSSNPSPCLLNLKNINTSPFTTMAQQAYSVLAQT